MTIRCPHCGSPVKIRGSRWGCGYCGDFGSISSLHPSEKDKLMQIASRWSEEELAEMHTLDLLVEAARRDPQTALESSTRRKNTSRMRRRPISYWAGTCMIFWSATTFYRCWWRNLSMTIVWHVNSSGALMSTSHRKKFSMPAVAWARRICKGSC